MKLNQVVLYQLWDESSPNDVIIIIWLKYEIVYNLAPNDSAQLRIIEKCLIFFDKKTTITYKHVHRKHYIKLDGVGPVDNRPSTD